MISVELGSCQTGWKAFGQNCYQVNSNKKSWIQARLACANQRADLVSIHSPVEQAHIALQVGPYELNAEAWIGNFPIAVAYFLLTALFVFFEPRNMLWKMNDEHSSFRKLIFISRDLFHLNNEIYMGLYYQR